jgi:transcriptional regulator with XRE-family HTH domain
VGCNHTSGDALMVHKARSWRDMRIESGLTLRQLEVLSGINRGEISRIERGRACATPEQAEALLAAYAVPRKVEP